MVGTAGCRRAERGLPSRRTKTAQAAFAHPTGTTRSSPSGQRAARPQASEPLEILLVGAVAKRVAFVQQLDPLQLVAAFLKLDLGVAELDDQFVDRAVQVLAARDRG